MRKREREKRKKERGRDVFSKIIIVFKRKFT